MAKSNLVLKHFDSVPSQWDALYSHENKTKHFINKLLRPDLFERHRFTFEQIGNDLQGGKILDVGCGTGRYSIECAKRGAKKVVGLDFAPGMIEFSKQTAEQMGVSKTCEFLLQDFTTYKTKAKFDAIIFMGLFDYVADPLPVLEKAASLKPKHVVASFPKFKMPWSIQRYIRYKLKNCPIYYYDREQIADLAKKAGFKKCDIKAVDTGYLVHLK